MLIGRTEVSSGEYWWQSNVDEGARGGRFVEVSGFQGQSSHSFRSVSTDLSEIVREGFGDLSICELRMKYENMTTIAVNDINLSS